MPRLSDTHEQLISLQRLCLDGRPLEFRQAFLSLKSGGGGPAVWSCTLRGVPAVEQERLEGELSLRAQALDGRTVEGLVAVSGPAEKDAEPPAVLELAGLGALLIKDHRA
jgi:hypothetical protein